MNANALLKFSYESIWRALAFSKFFLKYFSNNCWLDNVEHNANVNALPVKALPFCLSSSKTNMQSLRKRFESSRDSQI